MKRLEEQDINLHKIQNKSSHLIMKSESKQMVANELEDRNRILADNLDKVKVELYSLKTSYSSLENDKYDLEKEVEKLRKDLKSERSNLSIINEEKEHLL